jgi:predicted HAD superfamily Cof-like phosphohydrolase
MSMPHTERESNLPLMRAVARFMTIAGQSTKGFNARQSCLYTGLQLEEMAEKIEEIMKGTITASQREHFFALHDLLVKFADEFKKGLHEGAVLRADHAQLIDADFDLAWVSVASLFSESTNADGAVAHGTFTNLDKFRDGVVLKDPATGKVKKPADWQAPNFVPYTDPSVQV